MENTYIYACLATENECAAITGMSVHFLRKDRQKHKRIPYIKIGRAVRYDLDRVYQALYDLQRGGI